MGLFSKKKTESSFPWRQLQSSEELHNAMETSNSRPVLLFKHSTRCSISSMALRRFESNFDVDVNCELLYLDLLQYRSVSNEIAELTGVEHQSPQAILLFNNQVIYHASHSSIDASIILERIKDK